MQCTCYTPFRHQNLLQKKKEVFTRKGEYQNINLAICTVLVIQLLDTKISFKKKEVITRKGEYSLIFLGGGKIKFNS